MIPKNTPARTGYQLDPGVNRLDGYECTLPPEVRAEIERKSKGNGFTPPPPPPPPPPIVIPPLPAQKSDGWIYAALLGLPLLGLVLLVSLAGHRSPSPLPAVIEENYHPATEIAALATPAPTLPALQSSPTPVPVSEAAIPAPRAAVVGWPVPSAASLFPAGPVPLWRYLAPTNQWIIQQPGFSSYVLYVSPECTVSRATMIGKQVVPRAALLRRVEGL